MNTATNRFLSATATLMLAGGCVSQPAMLRPASPALRRDLGRVAIVALTDTPGIRYQVPDSKADIAAEAIEFKLITPCTMLRNYGGGPDDAAAIASGAVALAAPPVIMVAEPFLQEIRRAYGLSVADPAEVVAAARMAMDAAVAHVRVDQQLGDRVLSKLANEAPAIRTVSAREAADTILELMVYEPNVSSPSADGINPKLSFSLGLRVRLLDARTGDELYYDYLDYRGPKRKFVEWAAHDGGVFRDELDRCLANLSAEVVAQLFTRPRSAIAERGALAALGIERRPPTPLTSGSGLRTPAYRPAVYARR